MIYGIKQIEKQFPGFEACFFDAQLFDMREVFAGYNKRENPESSLKLSHEIETQYADLLKPPAEKMYIVKGRGRSLVEKGAADYSTEYAIWFADPAKYSHEELGVYAHSDLSRLPILIKEIFITDYNHQTGAVLAKRYKRVVCPGHPLSEKASFVLMYPSEKKALFKYLFNMPFSPEAAKIPLEVWQNTVKEDLAVLSCDLKILLFYLNVRNIQQLKNHIPFPHKRGFYFPKAWGREYKVLSLSRTLIEQAPSVVLPPGYRLRGHFCRGHFKRKPHGVYWWNYQWRGDFSKGIVIKDYKMEKEEPPIMPKEEPPVEQPPAEV